MPDTALSFVALLPLLVASLLAHRLAGLETESRRRLSSFAGGVAAAYVFLLVLPKLAEQQTLLERAVSEWMVIEYFYHHAYVVALIGFTAYYLVNALAKAAETGVPRTARGAALVISFGAYFALIGDLVAAQPERPLSLAVFSLALTLHIVGLNLSISRYLLLSWRWLGGLLTAFLFLGWLVGRASPIPAAMHALVSAWLAGGIIILVVLIELPEQRRPGAFVAGAATFAVLLKLNLFLTGSTGGV